MINADFLTPFITRVILLMVWTLNKEGDSVYYRSVRTERMQRETSTGSISIISTNFFNEEQMTYFD